MHTYQYNGVELPALPEWDTKTYPYAVISRLGITSSEYTYRLRVFKEPYTVSSTTISYYSFFKVPVGDVYLFSSCAYNNPTEWSEPEEMVAENESGDFYTVLTGTNIIWSTFDIMAGDAVVFEKNGDLPKTEDEPVPVPTLTERDLYRKINGQPTKLTLYKKVGGELVALDEYTQGGNL